MGIRSFGSENGGCADRRLVSGSPRGEGPRPVKLTHDGRSFEICRAARNFLTPQEVTKACLSCHTEAAGQIQRTKHWTWNTKIQPVGRSLGKKDVINNFAFQASNNSGCMSGHIGYG